MRAVPKRTQHGEKNKYDEIADFYRRAIDAGDLLPGTPLPRLNDLAKRHKVSYATMYKVIMRLQDEAYFRPAERVGGPVCVHLGGSERKGALLRDMLNELDAEGEGVQLVARPGERRIVGRTWDVVMHGNRWELEKKEEE